VPLTTKLELDLDDKGKPKLVGGSLLRFKLNLYGGPDDSELMMVVEGFRADPDLTTIIPPVSSKGNYTFHIVKLTPKATEGLLSQLRDQLNGRGEPYEYEQPSTATSARA
jgi:hypothetical protein